MFLPTPAIGEKWPALQPPGPYMRVRDAHVDVFPSTAIELNNHEIYIKSDERLVSSVSGVPAVAEATTIKISIRNFSNQKHPTSIIKQMSLVHCLTWNASF
jgi:hypothetical protein